MERVNILNISIDPVTVPEAVSRMKTMLAEPRFHHVMTPNNEMLVYAQSHPSFATLLRSADLNLADSTGLLLAARWTGQTLPSRAPGVDVVAAFCGGLSQEHSVFFLGAAEGVAGEAAQELQRKNPSLVIAGTFSGSPKDTDAPGIIDRINASGAKVLFVAFGAPHQDEWIARYRDRLPHIRLAMGVGGTFDFLADTVRRAPKILRSLGLEWLWRLIVQPWRVKRIWNAVVVFPWLVLTTDCADSTE